ncbi:MAG: DUF3108 domain-containing protein [Chthoniobacterales bacterium]
MDPYQQINSYFTRRERGGFAGKIVRSRFLILAAAFVLPTFARGNVWMDELTDSAPGPLAVPADFEAKYEFGWSGFIGGGATFRFTNDFENDVYEVEAHGGTSGMARTLWRIDAEYRGRGRRTSLLPIGFSQTEKYRRYSLFTKAKFTKDFVERKIYRSTQKEPQKWKKFRFPLLRDLVASMLFVRSHSLKDGEKIVFLSFPGDSPFLVEMRVERRELINWQGGQRKAIRLNQKIRRIETKGAAAGSLTEHGKYRSGTIWISDDEWRIPLRAEVNIFIGYVYGEMTELRWLKK